MYIYIYIYLIIYTVVLIIVRIVRLNTQEVISPVTILTKS